MPCPSRDELSACLLGKIPDVRAAALLDHAESCPLCSALVASLDQNTDLITDTLRRRNQLGDVVPECERMMDRAEGYVQADYVDNQTETRQHLLQGTRVRDYELIRPIGEGGMGAVFLARHNRLKRDVALKVLSLRRAGDKEAQQRFEQEMTIVGKLQHPGIVRALDAGEHEGVQYLVMELVNGADLRQVVNTLGSVPVSDVCEIGRRVAIALGYAHDQQLIHRDVKPSNIMLSEDGAIKVMDLGLARFTDQHLSITSTKQAMGSLDFMAPEQLRAEDVDHRADIYGLACTLHFLLTGEPPEKRRTASLMVARTPKLESVRNLLPPPLSKLLQQMLAHDPAKRCSSFSHIADQLAPFCSQADLRQLAVKATSVGIAELAAAPEEITSTMDENGSAGPLSRRLWIVAALLVGLVAGLPLGWLLFRPRRGDVAPMRELTSLPCVSSSIDPTREIPLFQIHDAAVRSAAYCEATGQLICGSDDASVSIRDLPNQRRITRICKFDSPVRKIKLGLDVPSVVCLDDLGTLMLIRLPDGETLWHVPAVKSRHRTDFQPLPNNRCAVRYDDSTIELVSMKDGAPVEAQAEDAAGAFPASDTADQLVEGLLVRGEPIYRAAADETDRSICVLDGHVARLVDTANLDAEHFVYAEHAAPICTILALVGETLFFSADEAGEIRLWQAPRQPRSDMLLSCATKVDSSELTFAIHRQRLWSRLQFSDSPETTKYDDPSDEIRIETELERNGRRHVLEYRINASDNS